ncbi:MAG: hypothetical protein L6R37_006037 [Teloschistes peruensis]|nr:MAG: hypothetical protein L6R37_006037 [Teloschistes peruensis]
MFLLLLFSWTALALFGVLGSATFVLPGLYPPNLDARGVHWLRFNDAPPFLENHTYPGPQIEGIGVGTLSHSSERVTDYQFMLTALRTLEEFYYTHPYNNNSAIPLLNYTGLFPAPYIALNVSAIGRGREAGLPITFTNAALVVFLRWLAQSSVMFGQGTWSWVEFDCQFSWRRRRGNESTSDFVARGNFTVFPGEVV